MTFSLETIIYIYLFVSVSIIFFNIACMIIRKREEKTLEKKAQEYKKRITKELDEENKNEEHQKFFLKKLQKVRNFTAYHEAVKSLIIQNPKKTYAYLKRYEEIFNYLIQVYAEKDNVYKAYYAYLMSVYKVCDAKENNFITNNILEMTKENSLYTRENAMKALLAFGNVENVILAIKNIERMEYTYNKKMLTDDLLEFSGNHEKLMERLLEELTSFKISTQVGIINYISYKAKDEKIKQQMYELLVEEDTDKEIKLAIIRFFGRYPQENVKDILYKYINSENTNDWEYAAVSAFALKNYKEKESKNILIKALSHPNWYVRKNAASSLTVWNLTKNDIQKIIEKKDKYANEILIYELEKKKEMEKC